MLVRQQIKIDRDIHRDFRLTNRSTPKHNTCNTRSNWEEVLLYNTASCFCGNDMDAIS